MLSKKYKLTIQVMDSVNSKLVATFPGAEYGPVHYIEKAYAPTP